MSDDEEKSVSQTAHDPVSVKNICSGYIIVNDFQISAIKAIWYFDPNDYCWGYKTAQFDKQNLLINLAGTSWNDFC